jgi:hypothetical protein
VAQQHEPYGVSVLVLRGGALPMGGGARNIFMSNIVLQKSVSDNLIIFIW